MLPEARAIRNCLYTGASTKRPILRTNRDILTKELSKIRKFFVLLCMRILFARDKSSLVLSQDTCLNYGLFCLGLFCKNLTFFRESKFRDNLNQGCFD